MQGQRVRKRIDFELSRSTSTRVTYSSPKFPKMNRMIFTENLEQDAVSYICNSYGFLFLVEAEFKPATFHLRFVGRIREAVFSAAAQ